MLQFLLNHALAVRLLSAPLGALLALSIAARALRPPQARHGRRRGVHRGLPTEIRRHRRSGQDHTWANTKSLRRVAPPTEHTLDDTAERRRYAAANRYEHTDEITQADLEALLGPRPAALIGAAA